MFEGAYNLRDLGGIPGLGGRRVKAGHVFRSGSLAHFSPAAVQALLGIGVSLIVDLRSGPERSHGPSPAPLEVIPHWRMASESLGNPRPLLDLCLAGTSGRDAMRDIYRSMPIAQAEAYRALFHHIARGHTPLLFHCAAGKDRTGVASALLLALLGVGREAIVADYVESDAARERTRSMFLTYVGQELVASEALWSPILNADPGYLDAMFGELARQYGDIIGYANAVLRLSPKDIEVLRETLLE
ncbi:tyrosine-protein phosphatase [Sphingosinicella microcystinivorans]|uniref:tyrosine-protein phosphatase n=1 Tax=Sphingosinicella microcystinivorans TaxID=335406 RepID=UPI0022F3D56F|nr:tyrosine-protein phosphatase [Sphingosinicella microcystinivorans]WBX85795.1 tyrosine-protein phosphatase [Sphingosinicella microcystinivorans]